MPIVNKVEVAPAPDNLWQAGQFAFFYFYVGQGNCCLIVCPNKQLVMIDCGSLARFPATAKQEIRDRILMYTGTNNKTIDYFIITHADRDHYNQIQKVLGDFTITTLLISSATAASPMYHFKGNQVGNWIYAGRPTVGTIKEVSINENRQELRTWTPPFGKAQLQTATIKTATQPVVTGKYGATNWSVEIVAGNVGYDEKTGLPNAKAVNAASLVTLVTYGAQKYINPGDATALTENFLLNKDNNPGAFYAQRKAAIQNVSIALVSHHGSDDEANIKTYVDWLNAGKAIVSVQAIEKTFADPKDTTMKLYKAKVSDGTNNHAVDTWEAADDFWKGGADNKASRVVEKWDKENKPYTRRWIYYTLNTIPPEGGVYMAAPYKGMMLRRDFTIKNLISNGTLYATGNFPFFYSIFTP